MPEALKQARSLGSTCWPCRAFSWQAAAALCWQSAAGAWACTGGLQHAHVGTLHRPLLHIASPAGNRLPSSGFRKASQGRRSSWGSERLRRQKPRGRHPRTAQVPLGASCPAGFVLCLSCGPSCIQRHMQDAAGSSRKAAAGRWRVQGGPTAHAPTACQLPVACPCPACAADVMLSPVFTGEALADAWLAEAQASMAAAEWEDAEATLSDVSGACPGPAQQAGVCNWALGWHMRHCALAATAWEQASSRKKASLSCQHATLPLPSGLAPAGPGGGRVHQRGGQRARRAGAAADRAPVLAHGARHAGRGAVPRSSQDAAAEARVGRCGARRRGGWAA